MQFLLENGANPNLKDSGYGNCLFNRWLNEYLGEDNDYNNTRNLKALTLLLKHGFDINDALNTIAYHLHEESDSNNSKISDLVSLLIDEYRADIDLACSRGYTPLQVAANKGYTKMMQIFLDHGANVKNVVHNLCKALEFLVRSKEYTTSQDVNDMTPLISIFKPFEKVTFYGTPVIPLLTHATILIANGARIDHPDIILSIAKIPAGSLTLEFRGALYKNIKIYQYHDEILNLCGNQAQKDAIENLLKDIAACQYYAEALADSNFHNLPHVVMDSYLKPAKDGEVSSLQTLCAREIIKQPEKYFDMLLLSVENQEVPLISEIGFESLD